MSELAVVHYSLFGHSFCDRTQGIQIDGIMSDFASLLCGYHRTQLWDQWNFVCIFFHLVRHHNTGYHLHADGTHLYISFKCKDYGFTGSWKPGPSQLIYIYLDKSLVQGIPRIYVKFKLQYIITLYIIV